MDILNQIIDLNSDILYSLSLRKSMEFIKKDIKDTILPKIDKIIESNGSNKPVLVLLDYIKNTITDCTREDIIKLAFLNHSFIKIYSKNDIDTKKTITKTIKKRKKRKDHWKKKELEIVKNNIYKLPVKEIKLLLPKRSISAIGKKAWELGYRKRKNIKSFPGKWNKAENNILIKNPYKSAKFLMKLLPGRTDNAIYNQRNRLGLTKEKNVNKRIQEPKIEDDKPRITIIGIDDVKKSQEPELNKVSEKDTFKDFNDDFLALKQYILDWSEKNKTDIIDIELMEKNRLMNTKYYSINSIFKGLKTLEEEGLSKQITKNKFIIYRDKIMNQGV